MLLLARSDGDWWEALRQRDLGIKTLLMEDEPIALTPLAASPVDRQVEMRQITLPITVCGHRRLVTRVARPRAASFPRVFRAAARQPEK